MNYTKWMTRIKKKPDTRAFAKNFFDVDVYDAET